MPTAISRWNPLTELGELRSRFDRMLADLAPDEGERGWMPAVDVVRDDGSLVLRADLPGITPEEVTVEVEDGVLTVSGHHDEHREAKDEHYLRRERHAGAFSRSMALPADVDTSEIRATVKDGVVEVKVPVPALKAAERVTITPTGG